MKYYIYILLSIISLQMFGQKQANVWYFGNNAGVEFSSGTPSNLSDGQTTALEGISTISDSSGALLFYSDGMTVWNKNHQVMMNGTNLLGHTSTTQSSIIVPSPLNPDKYYFLFTVSSGFAGGHISDGLRYSKVDICLDDSKGGIISGEKNIILVDTVAEKIAVTRHSNGLDYWVLTHKYYSNEFWALHLTANGIVDTIVTAIGSVHTDNGSSAAGSQGQLKFSNNGHKIAIAASNGLNLLELFDFDNATGIVSNFQELSRLNNGAPYGIEFSPDDSKLYVASYAFTPFGMYLSQLDLNAGNLPAINASLNSINFEAGIITGGRGLQIGLDGKIYMVGILDEQSLASINKPNVYGVGCDFQNQSISLSGTGKYTLPSFIAGFDYSNGLSDCDLNSILESSYYNNYTVYPNPANQATRITFVDLDEENYSLKLYSVNGRLVRMISDITTNEIIIKKENLSKGLYFFQLYSNQQLQSVGKLMFK